MSPPAHSALQHAIREHGAFVRRLAAVLARDANEADDLIQDTWVHVLERAPDSRGGLRGWLAAAVRGLARNRRRGEQRRERREAFAARAEVQPCPSSALALRQEVIAAVLALEEPFRRTLVLAYDQGLTPAAIAALEGVPASTVRTRLHRAHGKLRARLAPDERGDAWLATLAGLALPEARVPAAGAAALQPLLLAATTVGAIGAGTWAVWRVARAAPHERLGAASVPAEPPRSVHLRGGLAVAGGGPALHPPTGPRVRTPSPPQVGTAAAVEDHPFWKAVRAARTSITRYRHAEPQPTAALRERLAAETIPRLVLPSGGGLRAAAVALGRAAGVPISTSASAEEAARTTGLGVRWLEPGELSLAEALDVLAALAGQQVDWEVRDGAVHFDTWGGLAAHAVVFEYGVADLLLRPADYFDPGGVPFPLYAGVAGRDEWLTMLVERAGTSAEAPGIAFETGEESLVVRHVPRFHERAQRRLDALRRFIRPLPEDGVPGETLRIVRRAGDERLIRAIAGAGGPSALAPIAGVSQTERLRSFGRRHGVGVLWTAAARAPGAPFERLRFHVHAGCLWVLDASELLPCFTASELLLDLRPVLVGGPLPRSILEGNDFLWRAAIEGSVLALEPDAFQALVRDHIAPASWDQDPQNCLRIAADLQLYVAQSPWVLDEIVGLVDSLRRR